MSIHLKTEMQWTNSFKKLIVIQEKLENLNSSVDTNYFELVVYKSFLWRKHQARGTNILGQKARKALKDEWDHIKRLLRAGLKGILLAKYRTVCTSGRIMTVVNEGKNPLGHSDVH